METIRMKAVHLLIKGKVQGVFYRVSAQEEAERLGLKGWVKNTREGDVEVMAVGAPEAVDQFIQWCHRGPSRARVTAVIITEKSPEDFDRFAVIR